MPQAKKQNKKRLAISPTDAQIARETRRGGVAADVAKARSISPLGTRSLDLLDQLQGRGDLTLEQLLSILKGEASLGEIKPGFG